MNRDRPFLVEALTLLALIAAPFVLPYLGFTPTTINRILIWGLVGIGFDLLFGYTGLLSFGQSAFFGTGGMFAAWLLTQASFTNTIFALILGTIVAGIAGYLIGLVALRRSGIYFAMITIAIAEVFFYMEFNPLSAYTGGENGLPGVPRPNLALGFTTIEFRSHLEVYAFMAFWYFVGLVTALRLVRSPFGLILRAIRDNPLRAVALGHNTKGYKLAIFVIAAMYAGFAGGLLGMMQGFMPPDAFMFHTSAEIVMQTAIGGAGTLFGPLLGAATWLYLSDLFQVTFKLGPTWKLILGIVFVLLVIFLRHGLVGALTDLFHLGRPGRKIEQTAQAGIPASQPATAAADRIQAASSMTAVREQKKGTILEATGLSKHYGGLIANRDIDFRVEYGEIRGIIGPNGAGKSTFFKTIMGTERPTTGKVFYKGQDVTRLPAYARARRGLSVKFQNLRTFGDLSVLQNLYPALRRRFSPSEIPARAEELLARVRLDVPPDRLVKHISHGQQQWLAIATAMASEPDLLLLDEPTAGLGPEETHLTAEIIRDLNAAKVTVVVIEHDMGFIRSLCGRTSVLHYGALFAQGTFEEMAADPRVQKIYLGTE